MGLNLGPNGLQSDILPTALTLHRLKLVSVSSMQKVLDFTPIEKLSFIPCEQLELLKVKWCILCTVSFPYEYDQKAL